MIISRLVGPVAPKKADEFNLGLHSGHGRASRLTCWLQSMVFCESSALFLSILCPVLVRLFSLRYEACSATAIDPMHMLPSG